MSQTDLELLERSILGETQSLVPLNKHSNILSASLEVKAGTGILYGFSVYNSKGSAQFILVFDERSLPANGAVPAAVFTVATVANLDANWLPGRTFLTGCVLANSSTAATLTIGSADCWFDVQYV